jgi:hypothetical protein
MCCSQIRLLLTFISKRRVTVRINTNIMCVSLLQYRVEYDTQKLFLHGGKAFPTLIATSVDIQYVQSYNLGRETDHLGRSYKVSVSSSRNAVCPTTVRWRSSEACYIYCAFVFNVHKIANMVNGQNLNLYLKLFSFRQCTSECQRVKPAVVHAWLQASTAV